jgi:hypothetical protein
MREHHLSVMSLEEYEPNREFVGRNFNAGEVIQLVLKTHSGHWLPFNYVQMVMMHESVLSSNQLPESLCLTFFCVKRLAHCKQMNHSRAFWAVRNQYAEQMRALWARGFTGEGLWGRGALLSTGEFERNTVASGEALPEHLCGGTYRSRASRKRKAKKVLSYQEQKERRILKKFGAGGVKLGEDEEVKRKLEKGKAKAAKPRVAGSARGRELRAAAALARFEQQKTEEITDEGSETESGDDDYEDDDTTPGANDALDIDGKRLLDSKGRGMVKVCEDENPEDQDAQQELRELQSFGSVKSVSVPKPSTNSARGGDLSKSVSKTTTTNKPPPTSPARRESAKSTPPIKSIDASPAEPPGPSGPKKNCPVCTFANEPQSATCAMCASVLDQGRIADSWACESRTCHGTNYRNAGDCGVCGVCGERRPRPGLP